MSKKEREVLRDIMRDLKDGYSFGKDCTWSYYRNAPLDYPYFGTALFLSADRKYIHWQHFGSSANKATLKDLLWIITVIFETTPSGFLREYIRCDESVITA